jgi:hypothetical protein
VGWLGEGWEVHELNARSAAAAPEVAEGVCLDSLP